MKDISERISSDKCLRFIFTQTEKYSEHLSCSICGFFYRNSPEMHSN